MDSEIDTCSDVVARNRHRRWCLAGAVALALAACAALPPQAPAGATAVRLSEVRVEDERGPLGRQRAASALRRLDAQVASDLLTMHLKEVEAIVNEPLVLGNDAHLLIDGPQTRSAMLRAVGEARREIALESYIFEATGMGAEIGALLERKSAQGVVVRVLYDSVGSMSTPAEYFERLRAAGIAVCEFNPVNPLKASGDDALTLNNRNHRKVLVVDQSVAFTGGINISSVYSSGSFSSGKSKAGDPKSGWRDTHVVVRGPIVERFQNLFEDTWQRQKCPEVGKLARVASTPAAAPARAGSMAMRLVASDPLVERSELYHALLSAIKHAREQVWLTYGYFVPDDGVMQALAAAAGRGVDVRLVLPGFSDFWAPFHAGRSRYGELLAAGARLFERRDALLHAKTAVIDGVWASVGSTNLDWRSFVHNYEADILVLDRAFAGELEELFALDEAASHEVTRAEWDDRSLRARLLEWLARRWEYFL